MSTVEAELRLRLSSQALLVRLFFLLALCAALSPQPGAGYTIIKIGDMVPIMSADTALVAAAIVINLLIVLVFSLMLDVGQARDARLNVTTLFRTQPITTPLLTLGRLLTNIVYGLGFAAVAGGALMTTLSVRYGTLPNATSFAIFLLLVAPAAITAAAVGALIDLVLPDRPALKTVTALVAWIVILMMGLGGSVDVVGTGAIHSLLGAGHHRDGLSLGFVPTDGTVTFPWRQLKNVDLAFVLYRLMFACVVTIVAASVTFAVAPLLHRASRSGLRRAGGVTTGGAADAIPPYTPPYMPATSNPISQSRGLVIASERLHRRSPYAVLVLVAAFVIGCMNGVIPGIAIATIVAVPFLLLARTSRAEVMLARTIEQCEPALQCPTAALTNGAAILPGMLLAALPAIARMSGVQALTAVCGMTAVSLWLTLTHRVLDMPLLGVSVAGLLLYVLIFNHPPASMDIMGLWSPSAIALGVAATIAAVLTSVLAFRRP